ncbi:hypothetical protein QL093DRAFT_2629500 [Fusarium oxysporum]|nr:hypothetical protein QL093DRAFT_2629500 [Fusarium oxysporum]
MRVCSGEAENSGATGVLEYKEKEATLTATAPPGSRQRVERFHMQAVDLLVSKVALKQQRRNSLTSFQLLLGRASAKRCIQRPLNVVSRPGGFEVWYPVLTQIYTSSHLESSVIEIVNGFLFTPEANKACIDPDPRRIIAIPVRQCIVASQHHCSLLKTTTDSNVPLQDASLSYTIRLLVVKAHKRNTRLREQKKREKNSKEA